MEPDEKLEINDERGKAAGTDGAESGTPSEPEDDGRALPPMDVYDLLKTTINLLSNGAWAWMGLTPSPFSGKMERDLEQAKLAIDTVAYLAGQLDAHLNDTERREMQNVVSMLRVNYVQQAAKP